MPKKKEVSEQEWWRKGVVYHIYPRSFYDSKGDGIGDLLGIISKLDYLQDLGIKAIWLSPIYESTHRDFGYDISHYRKIDPIFGTLDDFKSLVEQAHQRNIYIIMDMVLNHTSDKHDWFQESKSSIDNPKRDWYIWKKRTGKRPPNNWKSAFGGSGWTYDATTDSYYYHSFLKEQPDLNWRNKELEETLFGDIKYWLDMGVDGFRLDVINMIGKDKKFRNNPSFFSIHFRKQEYYSRNRKRSIRISQKLRELMDSYSGEKLVVGEIFAPPPGNAKLAASYLGKQDKNLNMTFDFSLIFARWSAKKYYESIEQWYARIPKNGWPSNVLSNHDLLRSINRFKWRTHKLAKAKLEALLLLTLRGTPFVYYGEEIGQANYRMPKKQIKDPLGKKYWPFYTGRDPSRTPMQWNNEEYAGFSTHKPWLPVNKRNAFKQHANVAHQEQRQYSILNLYKRLIKLRDIHPSLSVGKWVAVDKGENGILSYYRKLKGEKVFVVLNFTNRTKVCKMPKDESFDLIFSINKPSYKYHSSENNYRLEPFGGVLFLKEK